MTCRFSRCNNEGALETALNFSKSSTTTHHISKEPLISCLALVYIDKIIEQHCIIRNTSKQNFVANFEIFSYKIP